MNRSALSLAIIIIIYSCSWLECCCKTTAVQVLDVRSFGAIGDELHDDTLAIRRALEAASNTEALVYFPKNHTFLSGPLNLTSHTTLQIEGCLKAINGNTTTDWNGLWPLLPPLPSYGNGRDGGHYLQYQAFLYAKDATQIRITGAGTIHGNGEWWWSLFQHRSPLLQAGRPNLVQFVNVSNIVVEGLTFRDSPFWCIHPVYSQNIHIHHIQIRSRMYAPNSDGIDPDSSQNVVIEHNDISCGDDHIAIKAGVCGESSPNDCTAPEFRNGKYETNNVTVRYNLFRTGMGIAVGSEMSGGIRNVFIHDNTVGYCKRGHCAKGCCGWSPGLHLKTTPTRGGVLENIHFVDNLILNTTSFIFVEMSYQSKDHRDLPDKYPPTRVQNVSFIGNVAFSGQHATFECAPRDPCHMLVIKRNRIESAQTESSPWSCFNVATFDVNDNYPPGLQDCMETSMNASYESLNQLES